MRKVFSRKTYATVAMVVASIFLLAGAARSFKVYNPPDAETTDEGYHVISETQLIIDGTFTGVVRKDGALYSTYDRTNPQAKPACPT